MQEYPDLTGGEIFYANAFVVLTRTRTAGFGVNPISLHDISIYIDLYKVEDVELFIEIIQAIDQEYLNFSKQIRPSKAKSNKPQNRRKR